MRRMSKKAIALAMAATMAAPAFQLTSIGALNAEAAENQNLARVMVHDPSIFQYNDEYYVFGSHIATAKSSDLMNWTQVSRDYQTPENNPIYGNVKENLKESFKWAGYDDGDCSGGGYAVWAPDVIYNKDYVWEDGHKGAYMLYYSASSTWRRSCIGYMVSDRADGGYQYGGTVVYSGFTNTGKVNYDGNSKRDTTYTNDYLPFNDLFEEGVVDDDVSTWKCFNKDGSWNNNYAPNAIDPTLFYDKTGKHLYMVYGSWSGGLFILELDKKTGEAIYPGKDGVDEASGNIVDRYFGVHITGGNHQSGEGPYIRYDEETGYYWLYETYGGLTTTGGYNMRLFRSTNPYGPYVDAAGNNAAGSGVDCYKYGTKLIGNYQFFDQPGYRAAGHNSALITEDGDYYLIYHQRFLDSSRGEGHEVRVHQQFLNEDDWLVTAVYENRDEQIQTYKEADVVGNYEFVNHGNSEKGGDMITTQSVNLNKDGSVSGDVTGTWTMADSDRGYTYLTIDSDGVTYKGVFFKQTNDNGDKVMTFTAIGNNNIAIWGSKMEVTDETTVKRVAQKLDNEIPSEARDDINLPKSLDGATIKWKTDNNEVISSKGTVRTPAEDTTVTLTATIKYGQAKTTKEFKVNVFDAPKVIIGYDFENVDDKAVKAIDDAAITAAAELIGEAEVVEDEERGKVLNVENQAGNHKVNYLSLPSDTFKNITNSGYTVSLYAKVDPSTFIHSALFEANGGKREAYPVTRIGANLIGRINAVSYSDADPHIDYSTVTDGSWHHIAYTVATNGIRVYLDGNLIKEDKKDISACFGNDVANIRNATTVMVGAGDIWGDEDCQKALFDDVKVYDTAFTTAELKSLYEGTDFPVKDIDEEEPEEEEPSEPETPENPETPEQPEKPENPETPEQPEKPEEPEQPSTPSTPSAPSNPGSSNSGSSNSGSSNNQGTPAQTVAPAAPAQTIADAQVPLAGNNNQVSKQATRSNTKKATKSASTTTVEDEVVEEEASEDVEDVVDEVSEDTSDETTETTEIADEETATSVNDEAVESSSSGVNPFVVIAIAVVAIGVGAGVIIYRKTM